jgi:hypothetical protein
MQRLAALNSGHAPDRALTGRASIFIAARDIAEVAFVERALARLFDVWDLGISALSPACSQSRISGPP